MIEYLLQTLVGFNLS